MTYLDRLNDKQKEAVLCTEGPLLVLAGAGSGKTSMMTCRIAYLIEQMGISPYNILAVTFTNKAAGEMRERVEKILEGLDGGYSAEHMWIQTFHSACLRILRFHADVIGYGKDFVVYDTTDQKTVIKSIIKEQNIDDKKYTPAYLLSFISDCKEKAIDAKTYLQVNGEEFRTKILYGIYAAYENTLRKNNAMDFDDLLTNAVKVFEQDEAVLLKYQNRFKYIMVDEYQDTNNIQYRFVKMLAEAHNNICVVGDDDQCIYQWRGADISNILNFEKDFRGAKVIKLEQNYRSTAMILDAAHSVISKNKQRKDKKLWTAKGAGEFLTYHRADDERDEARYVAQEIFHMQGDFASKNSIAESGAEPLKYGDFAILYRTNAQSRTFEEALHMRGIPAKVVGNVGFYERKEIKDVMAYLRLVQNPLDDVSFERIINEPKRGIGEKTLEKLRVLAQMRGESLLQLLCDDEIRGGLSSKAYASVTEMVQTLTAYGEEKENLAVIDIYDGILAKSGYLKALSDQNTVEAEGRIENIMELRSAIEQFQKENPEGRLMEFLEGKALASDSDKLPEGEEAEERNQVLLMTMHTAKGLEFPVVFMPGMEEGLFPGWRAMEREEGLEEERRLCYVGMTRAKEKLYLTSAQTRTLYGKTDYTRESSFLYEIDEKLIAGEKPYVKKSRSNAYEDGFGRDFDSGFGGGYAAGSYSRGFVDGYGRASAPAKPFDSLKYAKQEVLNKNNAASGEAASIKAGDKVTHTKFGVGTVIEADEKTITVEFDSEGRKKLARGIAPIKKI